jgi:hypothetical protein
MLAERDDATCSQAIFLAGCRDEVRLIAGVDQLFDWLGPDRYLKRNPQAGILFRRLSERNVAPDIIKRLMNEVPELRDENDK